MIRDFGRTEAGDMVEAVTLRAGGLSATVLTLGAILQDVRLDGVGYGLTLGSDNVADYQGPMRHHGSLVGPVANRIGSARAQVGGKECRFPANQADRHTLHSGGAGTQFKLWKIGSASETRLVLTLDLPDGEGGFPGNRHVTAEWQIEAPATLRLTVTTTTDAETIVNFTNHSYWNLDGSAEWAGHTLRIAADHVTEVDEDLIPTGRLLAVTDTDLDLRQGRIISPQSPSLDTNFCLSDAPTSMRDVLWLTGPSGVTMAVATTEPGIQVYDNRKPGRPGRPAWEGLAIEPQHWPDSPNQPFFPTVTVQAGGSKVQAMEWRFSV
jgi:aldose 1-epimerase